MTRDVTMDTAIDWDAGLGKLHLNFSGNVMTINCAGCVLELSYEDFERLTQEVRAFRSTLEHLAKLDAA